MFKKFFGLMFALIMIASNCFAMTFSQPVQIVRIWLDTAGFYGNGFIFEDAIYNNGNEKKPSTKRNLKGKSYSNGIAKFGNGSDTLYVHYDMNNHPLNFRERDEKFGDENISNTVDVPIWEECQIYQIKNDSPIKIYLICSGYSNMGDCFIIGKRNDGKFVKYIDTRSITEKYFGNDKNMRVFYDHRKMSLKGNQIIVPYIEDHLITTQSTDKHEIKQGEFRFKWDDAAQWFGVEQIIY